VRRNLFICLLLAGMTLAVYWPAGSYDFVRYDDPLFFVDNPEVQGGLRWHSFIWAMSSVLVANWHPVTSLSFVLTHQFFGTNPHAEHRVNVVFHIANALLLFLVLLRMTGLRANAPDREAGFRGEDAPAPAAGTATRASPPPAWRCAMVAAVFALHPLRVESVAWISERKDVLCGFFLMLTLWAWTRYVQKAEGNETSGKTSNIQHSTSNVKWWYWAAILFFALGLMSKAMLVTLPFLLLLLDVWPLRRIQISESRIQNLQPLIVEKIPFFALSAVFCVVTYVIQRNFAAMVSWEKLGWTERISNAIASYLQYLVKLFWPAKLAVIYPYAMNPAPDWELWNIALLLLAVSVLCVCLLPRKPYLAMGWFWYLGTAVPIIGLVQVGETAMADRYTYIPLIGPVIALVWLVSEKWKHEVFQKIILTTSGIALLAALAMTTHRQIGHWENTTTLFEHALEVTGENASAQSGLGIALEHEGRISEAMVHYRISLALNPADTQTSYNLGQLLVKRENWPEAGELFSTVLAGNPNDLNAHLMLGTILPHLDRNPEALQHLETALQINPDATEAMNNLAWNLATSEDPKIRDGTRAVQLAERACSLTGGGKTALIGTLAAAYAEAGRFDEAVATAQKACALAEKSGEPDLLQKNLELLELYRAHKPYREIPAKVVPAAP
jgi:protein O-mannosyl-transferase